MAKTNRPVLSEVRAVFDSLVKQHGLKSSFHRVLAWQISTALSKGELSEATRALALLPAPRGIVDHSPTVSAASARKRFEELVWNHVAAHQFEQGNVESAEVAALRAQVESLQDECRHLRGTKPRALPPPSRKPIQKAAASEKAPTPASSPAPRAADPTRAGEWDASENARKWREWNAAGGATAGNYGSVFSNDGLTAAGWISRLNSREW
jgi:hypothetical protein